MVGCKFDDILIVERFGFQPLTPASPFGLEEEHYVVVARTSLRLGESALKPRHLGGRYPFIPASRQCKKDYDEKYYTFPHHFPPF